MKPIIKYPNPNLGIRSKPVEVFDENLIKLLTELKTHLVLDNALGVAAPQVDESFQVFIVSVDPNKEVIQEFINPVITKKAGMVTFREGCLSFPGIQVPVQRAKFITVEYQDRHGDRKVLEAQDLHAVVIQHEYDHLQGITLADYMPSEARRFLKKNKKF